MCNPVLVALPGEMGGATLVGPPSPLQDMRSSGRKAQGSVWAWQAQGKKPIFYGELADGITGSEPTGTKHKIRPAY